MKVMMTTIVAVLLVGCATMLPPDLAIYDAVQKGDVEAAKQTIADGADVNAKDKDDFTFFIVRLHSVTRKPPNYF